MEEASTDHGEWPVYWAFLQKIIEEKWQNSIHTTEEQQAGPVEEGSEQRLVHPHGHFTETHPRDDEFDSGNGGMQKCS